MGDEFCDLVDDFSFVVCIEEHAFCNFCLTYGNKMLCYSKTGPNINLPLTQWHLHDFQHLKYFELHSNFQFIWLFNYLSGVFANSKAAFLAGFFRSLISPLCT